MTETQWMERWNEQAMENLWLDASEESEQADYSDEQSDDDDDEHFAIYDEDEDDESNHGIDYAALDGSGYL